MLIENKYKNLLLGQVFDHFVHWFRIGSMCAISETFRSGIEVLFTSGIIKNLNYDDSQSIKKI